MMIVVASLVLGLFVMKRRREAFHGRLEALNNVVGLSRYQCEQCRQGIRYYQQIAIKAGDPERFGREIGWWQRRLSEAQDRVRLCELLVKKYRRAAGNPWESVDPDPPWPPFRSLPDPESPVPRDLLDHPMIID